MKAVSCLRDARINAYNVLFEISIGDYKDLVENVLKKNVFQRKRVRSSKTVYSLLRDDLQKQCVIPPVVLALTTDFYNSREDDLRVFEKALEKDRESLVILDGLQRTYTILDLLQDLGDGGEFGILSEVMASKIRMEIYFGINRLGILYRMLTLNTGQTPMSLRQQIEILYLDYLDKAPFGVQLIRESEGRAASGVDQYNFKDIVEGFNAYLDRDELPIDKSDILENINSLERLSKENQSTDLFEKYLEAFSCFIRRVHEEAPDASLSHDYLEQNFSPFGKTLLQVFKKPQAMSGFGAAVGKLIDFQIVEGFDSVIQDIEKIEIDNPEEFLEDINQSLNWLKNNAKKIGNAQRSYFSFFFRDLLNPEGDSYLKMPSASKDALRKYQGQNM